MRLMRPVLSHRAGIALAVVLLALLVVPAAALALPAPAPPSVAGGYSDSLIVKSDGTLWAWGANTRGQLGLGDTLPREIPVQVGTGTDWAQVAIGEQPFVVALKHDGSLWAWGENSNGELGLGAWSEPKLTPQRVGVASDWAAVACGGDHVLALKQDGTLWSWGSDQYGGLGYDAYLPTPVADGYMPTPTQVSPGTWKAIAAGWMHSLAVRSDGTVWAWGANDYGQLGNGAFDAGHTLAAHEVPTQIAGATGFAKVGAGFITSFAIKADGSLWAWGNNGGGSDFAGGALGDGTNIDRLTPVRVGTDNDWTTVAGANSYTAGLKSDGTLWAWGYNSYGEVGISDVMAVKSPRRVGTRTDWAAVEPGAYHLLAVAASGQFGSCGAGYWGQTGIGYALYRPLGEQIGTEAGWQGIDASLGHTAGVRADGTLWTWGRNSFGELGQGDVLFGSVNSPLQVGTGTGWASVSCGDNTNSGFTAAIKTDGTLWTWGANDSRQLGLGDTVQHNTPAQVGSATDWKAVSCSDGVGDVGRGLWGAGDPVDFMLALRTDGTLVAWGDDSRGQLGQGDTAAETGRVAVQGLTGQVITTIATGDDYAMAISDVDQDGRGTLWAWGGNANAQLGLGTQDATTDHSASVTTPHQVGAFTDWMAVACGSGREGSHTMAIRDADGDGKGTLYGWGDDSTGQLGLGLPESSPRVVPTQVGTDGDWVAVSCGSSYGDDYTLARKADGSLWAFGGNYRGELGKGDYIAAYVPTRITSLSSPLGVTPPFVSASAIACGTNSFAILQDGTLWAWGDNAYGQLGVGDATVNPLSGVYGLADYVTADPDTAPPSVAATTTSSDHMLGASDGARAVASKWYKKAVTIKLSATDDKSGVSRVQYSLTGGVGWKTGASARISKQGLTHLKYRGLDRVRNASTVVERWIGVDSTRPKPSAPKGDTVKRGGKASLTYKVADVRGMTVKVTFVIKNAAGRTVKSWSRSGKAVNKTLTESFTCKLARGTYRFSVTARDLVGFTQVKAASNRLIVK
jgi:alpha-tubulin suppressor-like RCC1 family protein